MKNSGVEWIGEIPDDWEVWKVKHAFIRKNEKAMQENPTILSLARSGVKERDISNNEGQLAESYYNYNPVEIDDLLIKNFNELREDLNLKCLSRSWQMQWAIKPDLQSQKLNPEKMMYHKKSCRNSPQF